MSTYPFLKENVDGITITVHAQPRAKKNEIVGLHGDALKVRIAAPPVEGAANDEIIAFFAKFFGVTRASVSLKQGGQSRHKVLKIKGVTGAACGAKIGAIIGAKRGRDFA